MRLLLASSLVLSALVGFPSGRARADAPTKDVLMSAVDDIARQVAALRELPQKQQLKRGVLSRDEIGQRLKERLGKEYAPDEVRAEALVLKRLGLLPPDADYEKLLLDLLMEQVAGFYDPFIGRLFIADWLPLEMQRPALAHEIQHALQDQHFDLKKFATPLKDDGDRQLARAAIVEGDGTAVMLEFQLRSMGMPTQNLPQLVAQMGGQMLQSGMPLFDKAPAFLRETLIFPYLSGLQFVMALRRSAPWARIDQVFRKPPESTEQVLHIETYTEGEGPRRIVTGPLPQLSSLRELRRDVMGELTCRILLRDAGAKADVERACAGWGGDRLVAWTRPGAPPTELPTVVLYLDWDTQKDADEAFPLFARWLDQRVPAPAPTAAAPNQVASAPGTMRRDPNGGEWSLQQKGQDLVLVLGAPSGSHPLLPGEILRSWRAEAPTPRSSPTPKP